MLGVQGGHLRFRHAAAVAEREIAREVAVDERIGHQLAYDERDVLSCGGAVAIAATVDGETPRSWHLAGARSPVERC